MASILLSCYSSRLKKQLTQTCPLAPAPPPPPKQPRQANGAAGLSFADSRFGGNGAAFGGPSNRVGKLFMRFGGKWFQCSASVINRGLLVTAAHCVHDFGRGAAGYPDKVNGVFQVQFVPGLDGAKKPFGTWTATGILIPKSYEDGSDTCDANAPGIVCNNDIALLAVAKLNNKFIGDIVGWNNYGWNGYVSWGGGRQRQGVVLWTGGKGERERGEEGRREPRRRVDEAPAAARASPGHAALHPPHPLTKHTHTHTQGWATPSAAFDVGGPAFALLTQFGYPAAFDRGEVMQVSTSPGYALFAPGANGKTYGNVLKGSSLTGGSSGGPWIVNAGVDAALGSGASYFQQTLRNAVVGVTSWGYTGGGVGMQGSSYFGANAEYPDAAYGTRGAGNIGKLIFDACDNAALPAWNLKAKGACV